MPQMNMVQAINDALRQEMRRDARVVVLGEDVGKVGGVFRVTQQLFDERQIRLLQRRQAAARAGENQEVDLHRLRSTPREVCQLFNALLDALEGVVPAFADQVVLYRMLVDAGQRGEEAALGGGGTQQVEQGLAGAARRAGPSAGLRELQSRQLQGQLR